VTNSGTTNYWVPVLLSSSMLSRTLKHWFCHLFYMPALCAVWTGQLQMFWKYALMLLCAYTRARGHFTNYILWACAGHSQTDGWNKQFQQIIIGLLWRKRRYTSMNSIIRHYYTEMSASASNPGHVLSPAETQLEGR